METSSTRPYLIRALHEWCCDNGLTPYLVVRVDDHVQVPREYVKDGEIVLNVSVDATSALRLGNDFIEFKARFGGVARDIMAPVGHVMAIYARETGQGMAFPPEDAMPVGAGNDVDESAAGVRAEPVPFAGDSDEPPDDSGPSGGGRPMLKRVK